MEEVALPSTLTRRVELVGAPSLVLACVALTLPPVVCLVSIVGFLCVAAVLSFPFLGLYVIVLGTQLGGLIEWAFKGLGRYLLEGIALLTLLGIALNSYREPRRQRFGPDVVAFRFAVLYGMVILASYLLADNASGVEKELLRHLAVMTLFYLVIRLVRTMQQLKMLVVATSLAVAVSGSISVVEQATGRTLLKPAAVEDEEPGRRIGASSTSATTTGQMMLAGAGMALVLALRVPRPRKAFFLILATAGIAGMVLANSRSASLIGIVGLVWVLLKLRGHRRLPAILVVSLLLAATVLPVIVARQEQRFARFSLGEDYTLRRRLGYQLVGLDLVASHPLLGVGVGNFRHLYMSQAYRWMPARTLLPRDLANMYLGVATESGLLGLACFVGMLGSALLGLAQVRRSSSDPEVAAYAEALQFGYVLFLIACLVAPATTNKTTWLLTGLAAALPGVASPAWRKEPARLAGGRTLVAAVGRLFGGGNSRTLEWAKAEER